jgi:hypothetical protein
MVAQMQYRIEIATGKEGIARVHLPGRSLELEARADGAEVWRVAVVDSLRPETGTVELRAASANDAVWRVARAVVRAVSELTGNPIEGGLRHDPDPDAAR